jgi:hypothetical protein
MDVWTGAGHADLLRWIRAFSTTLALQGSSRVTHCS